MTEEKKSQLSTWHGQMNKKERAYICKWPELKYIRSIIYVLHVVHFSRRTSQFISHISILQNPSNSNSHKVSYQS